MIPTVVFSLLPQEGFGPNGHRKDASHFRTNFFAHQRTKLASELYRSPWQSRMRIYQTFEMESTAPSGWMIFIYNFEIMFDFINFFNVSIITWSCHFQVNWRKERLNCFSCKLFICWLQLFFFARCCCFHSCCCSGNWWRCCRPSCSICKAAAQCICPVFVKFMAASDLQCIKLATRVEWLCILKINLKIFFWKKVGFSTLRKFYLKFQWKSLFFKQFQPKLTISYAMFNL